MRGNASVLRDELQLLRRTALSVRQETQGLVSRATQRQGPARGHLASVSASAAELSLSLS
ncbi:hypothetical protein KIPB_016635, partial [Kipferlia bialata]|eukprot:g16635.t1